MDSTSENLASIKKSIDDRYEKHVLPEQRQIINQLSVSPSMEAIIGTNLTEQINNAFKAESHFSSPFIQKIAEDFTSEENFLGDKLFQMREVAYTDSNGKTIHLLVKQGKSTPNGQLVTETFELPNKTSALTCRNILITDTKDGRTIDLMDIIKPGSNVLHKLEQDAGYDIILDNLLLPPDIKPQMIMHEAGHSHQRYHLHHSNLPVPNIIKSIIQGINIMYRLRSGSTIDKKSTLVMVRSERNAWAFTLSIIRRYKQLGIDLYPDKKRLLNDIKYYLSSYDEGVEKDDPSIKFSKKKSWS